VPKRMTRMIGLMFVLAWLPFAFAQEEGESVAAGITIANKSRVKWILTSGVPVSSFEGQQFKDLAIDSTRLELGLAKGIMPSKFNLGKGESHTFKVKKAAKTKHRILHFSITDDYTRNTATFCLLRKKDGTLKLLLEKVRFTDDMGIDGVLELNQPEPGSLTITDPEK
jgi:hypothetical protein